MNEDDIRQERSCVVSGRVDVIKLAEIMAGLEANKFNVRTMSLLISYCIDVAHSAMEQNNLLAKRMNGILEAYYLLTDSGLMTRNMQKKNHTKMHMAQGLDEIRKMGGDPAFEAPIVYNTLHNRNSVQVPDTRITRAKAQEMVEQLEAHERQQLVEDDKNRTPTQPVMRQKYKFIDENGQVKPLPPRVSPIVECELPATDIPDEAATKKPDPKKQALAKYQAWKLDQQRKNYEANKARTSKDSSSPKQKDSDIPRQKTDEEIQADFDRIANKDKELMAALDSVGKPGD